MLHGLFGSARNFATLAAGLTSEAQVFALDARNHGRAEHRASHTLADLTADLAEFLAGQDIERPVLLGHSMGGLTVMNYARLYPENVTGLIVLDIAARSYAAGHRNEIAAQKLDLSQFETRKQVDEAMAKILPDATVRQFLQMNVGRDAEGRFCWTNNIAAIESSPERTQFPEFTAPIYSGPVLAVRGLKSEFVSDADVELMRRAFPALEQHDLPDAEHWLHHTHREVLEELILRFLRRLR